MLKRTAASVRNSALIDENAQNCLINIKIASQLTFLNLAYFGHATSGYLSLIYQTNKSDKAQKVKEIRPMNKAVNDYN